MESSKQDQQTLNDFSVQYLEQYFTFDKPVPFKTKKLRDIIKTKIDLLKSESEKLDADTIRKRVQDIRDIEFDFEIYPILVEDAELFFKLYWIFSIKKETFASQFDTDAQIKIIKGSNLDILELMCTIKELELADYTTTCLKRGFSLILRQEIKKIKWYYVDDDAHIVLNDSIDIDSDDFDVIRKIVSYQNIVDYSDKYVNPEIQEELDKINAIKNKQYKPVTLEDRLVAVGILTGYEYSYLCGLTYRRFTKIEKMSFDEQEYIIKINALSHGAKFKDGELEHFLYKKDRGLIGFTALDEVKNKFK